MRDRTLTPATCRVRGAPHYRPQAVQQATIGQPQVTRRFDVRSTCPQRGPVRVYPCWMRHWCCSHAKLEPVRLDTSRSPLNRLPTASPRSAARTNLQAGIQPSSAYRGETPQRRDRMARAHNLNRARAGRWPQRSKTVLSLKASGCQRLCSPTCHGNTLDTTMEQS
jgi:hypothetical protein